jgi:flagellin-like hook-associated protein FlgL
MSRIGGIGGLGTDQLRALSRIAALGQAISANQKRLLTLKRINSAADDPAGSVQAALLRGELTVAEAAARSVTRASAMLSTADAAAGDILSQLQSAKTLALEAAGGGLSDAEIAANQIQLDTILAGIDRAAGASFGGKTLLTGALGFSATSVNIAKVYDVDVTDKTSPDDVTIAINVTSVATRATDTYTGGPLASDVTLVVTGIRGTSTVSLESGASLGDIAAAINAATYATGITAAVDGGDVDFQSSDYGSSAKISIEATAGTFTLATGGTVTGTDAVATINGRQYTGDGATFSATVDGASFVVTLNPATSGVIEPFTITGSGLSFQVGSSPSSTARIGLPNLSTWSLGGLDGSVASLASGRGNSLIEGQAAAAVRVIDDAIGDVTRSRAVIGGFQKFTLDSASRVLDAQRENQSAALSAIEDIDVATETARLANNQLLLQMAFEALSIASHRNEDVLSLLGGAAGR